VARFKMSPQLTGGTEKTAKKICQDSPSPSRDLNSTTTFGSLFDFTFHKDTEFVDQLNNYIRF
jgi:hypothetical protein